MEWYEIVLIVAAGLFLFSTAGSLFFGDLDIGTGMESGFLLGDIFSFKGLLHFVLGFSLALTVWKGVTFVSVLAGVATGIVFAAVLYYLYKLAYGKLQQRMEYADEIKEMDAEVYFWSKEQQAGEVFVTLEGRPVQVTLKSNGEANLQKGQKIKVSGNRKLVYPVN